MRKIYLVRHGEPDIGTDESICLGRKDISLSQEGVETGLRVGEYFCREEIRENLTGIFSSPLKRCLDTACAIYDRISNDIDTVFSKIEVVKDFQEADTGIWDGLTFREIRERFPKEYEERGKQLGKYRIPEGETLQEAGNRFYDALVEVLSRTEGNLIVVTHAGIIRSFLCQITDRNVNQLKDWKIPYGSVTEIHWMEEEAQNRWTVMDAGLLPVEMLSLEKVKNMWHMAGTTEEQQIHMICTAEFAMEQADYLSFFSATDKKILYYSSLLHDLLRSIGRGHERAGAEWLQNRGYHELVVPVSMHNNAKVFQPDMPVSPAEILYYADKRVKDAEIVTIEERFAASRAKLKDEKGREMHMERMVTAFAIGQKLREHTDKNSISLSTIFQAMAEEIRNDREHT